MSKALYPGWRMTRAQHDLLLFTLWPEACAHQAWDKLPAKAREEKRREVAADVFGGPKSFTAINKTDEFGLIKARLEMLAGKIQGATEDGDVDADRRRRLMHRIGEHLAELPELVANAESYLQTILRDRFGVIKGVQSFTELGMRDLKFLAITLEDRIRGLKKKATTKTPSHQEEEENHGDTEAQSS